jgi:3-oxoacyl-[acyl-carrier-protein] synthase-1
MSTALAVLRVGMCCSVGLDAAQTASSIRAGVTRKSASRLLDAKGKPVILGHLADELLPRLVPALAGRVGPDSLEARLLRLGGRPLRDVLARQFADVSLPMLLAGPQAIPGEPDFLSSEFPALLAAQAKVKIEPASRVVGRGGTGFFEAILAARDELLVPGRSQFAIVGAIDSWFDDRRIAVLERDDRLRTFGPQDAFTPGEAAAFMILATEASCRRHSLTPLAWITAISLADGSKRRPIGEALATACSSVLATMREPVALVMAGLNGENGSAREWGVAALRNREQLATTLRVEHPAEYTGDTGAALAPMMLATAALHLRARTAVGPALVWSSSESGQRGALVLYAGS